MMRVLVIACLGIGGLAGESLRKVTMFATMDAYIQPGQKIQRMAIKEGQRSREILSSIMRVADWFDLKATEAPESARIREITLGLIRRRSEVQRLTATILSFFASMGSGLQVVCTKWYLGEPCNPSIDLDVTGQWEIWREHKAKHLELHQIENQDMVEAEALMYSTAGSAAASQTKAAELKKLQSVYQEAVIEHNKSIVDYSDLQDELLQTVVGLIKTTFAIIATHEQESGPHDKTIHREIDHWKNYIAEVQRAVVADPELYGPKGTDFARVVSRIESEVRTWEESAADRSGLLGPIGLAEMSLSTRREELIHEQQALVAKTSHLDKSFQRARESFQRTSANLESAKDSHEKCSYAIQNAPIENEKAKRAKQLFTQLSNYLLVHITYVTLVVDTLFYLNKTGTMQGEHFNKSDKLELCNTLKGAIDAEKDIQAKMEDAKTAWDWDEFDDSQHFGRQS